MAVSRKASFLSSPFIAILCLFYLFSSTALAASAVLGVDLGTEYIKASLVKPGIPLEIVLTKDSRRKELSTVTFKPSKQPKAGAFPERLYGSDAAALAARFPADVYSNLKTLLGLSADNDLVKEWASRRPALQLVADKIRGTVAFKSSAFDKDEESWTVEELLAMELQSIQKNAEALAGKGSVVKDLVISIPPFYTAQERRAVILAADLAGLRVLELITDGMAVGLNYATSRTFPSINDGGAPEHHMVFDMGAGSTKATILKFQGRTVKDVGKYNKTVQEVITVGSGWDRTLGGDAMNGLIVDDMIAKFVASPAAEKQSITAEAVKGHGRAVAKLWKEAERLRQVLSANANTQASFEGLFEDVDFRYKITRAEFEEMTEPFVARIETAMTKALQAAELSVTDLDSIILHGGAIRTPFVQKEVEKYIGNAEKVRSNVNSDESAVFGAGFRGAGLSPSFRVKEIRATDIANYAAGIKWINLDEKPQHQRLWQPTSALGAEKQFTFKNQKEFDILFYQHVASSEKVSPGSAEKELLRITTQNLTASVDVLKDKFACENKDILLKLSTKLSPSTGEVEIMKFFVDCEVEITEDGGSMVDSVKGLFGFGKKDQIPVSESEDDLVETVSAADSSSSSATSTSSSTSTSSGAAKSSSASTKDSKSKPTKRVEVIPIQYELEILGMAQLPKTEIRRMKDRIAAFEDSDRSQKQREEALNQLEGFTYKVRDLLDDAEFIAASTESERASLEAKSKAASDWIYSGGVDASREELKTRLKEMRDIVDPIEKRKDEAGTRPDSIKDLQKVLNDTKTTIDGIKDQIKKHEEAASSFSASVTASTEAPSPSAKVEDDFAGLEDEDASSTSSAAPAPTLDPPTYTEADIIAPGALYESVTIWLEEKIVEQDKLTATDDPILLTKDLAAKAQQLRDANRELIMKAVRQASYYNKPPKKPASAKKSKSSKSKKTKTASASGAKKSSGSSNDGKPIVEEVPLDEEILAAMDDFQKSQAEQKATEKEEKPVKSEEAKAEKAHVVDEL
ncbi:actin-like ATPase-containing protein [Coleophoma cylindrospora]|uniref:Actin-like ATPase-containing protein n=1 Tax=Coleophoma cylindrospora TaxID=1849047 RepID=A0A3D8SRM1_9HELO|nr:actin-like ATPase-containing protein [Coleophoma cylindrospora]